MKYEYTKEELIDIANELIVWRDGLELLGDNPFSKGILKRIDLILAGKRIEDNPITREDFKCD